jgi:EAL domain-containing protein (putative c-di-GMP-specific phosphodiesterase class I)
MEVDLRRAIDDDRLILHYQPIFTLEDGRLVGGEALVRFENLEGGLVFPGSFVKVAESSNLIRPIDRWVLDNACKQLGRWGPPGDFHLAVNFSGHELAEPGVARRVLDCAERTGVDVSHLVIELTEGVLIDAGTPVVRELEQLRDAGARLAIDDFGTGYCSLSYLQYFPVDTLKIDRSFVSGLGRQLYATAIVEAVVGLTRTLGLTAVAEGIEEPEQLLTLRSLGCQRGQGFFLGVPLDAEGFTALLAAASLEGGQGALPRAQEGAGS